MTLLPDGVQMQEQKTQVAPGFYFWLWLGGKNRKICPHVNFLDLTPWSVYQLILEHSGRQHNAFSVVVFCVSEMSFCTISNFLSFSLVLIQRQREREWEKKEGKRRGQDINPWYINSSGHMIESKWFCINEFKFPGSLDLKVSLEETLHRWQLLSALC